jgi:hypothetical protein
MAEWYNLADFRTCILDAGGPFFEAPGTKAGR